LANQYLSGNEKALYHIHKHHHLDDVVTQPPAYFVKKEEEEKSARHPKGRASAFDVPPPETTSAFPNDRPKSAVSSIDSLRIIRKVLFLCGNP
jgi:hypothetical protein